MGADRIVALPRPPHTHNARALLLHCTHFSIWLNNPMRSKIPCSRRPPGTTSKPAFLKIPCIRTQASTSKLISFSYTPARGGGFVGWGWGGGGLRRGGVGFSG